jgi:hypothetical protein
MSVIFADSWDHYSSITSAWDFGGTDCKIDLTGTVSRTGIGCLIITSAAFGPTHNLAVPSNKVIVGTAYYSNSVSEQVVIFFLDDQTGAQVVWIEVLADGALRVLTNNSPFQTVLGTSDPAKFQFSTYNYIEAKVNTTGVPGTASVVVHCNGHEVLNLTGLTLAAGTVRQVQLMAAGGIPDARHDDTYIIDWTLGPNSDFLGPVNLYTAVPDADVSVSWTPSAGSNFQNVDEIPPNGDTDYNSSSTIGQSDLYRHPLTAVPANSTVFALVHRLDLKVDSGARTVNSDVFGSTGGAAVLTSGYKIYTFPLDINPNTGLTWAVSDFPVSAGPIVTA